MCKCTAPNCDCDAQTGCKQMKKVLIPLRREESIRYCDKHHDRECNGDIQITFNYGSKYDLSEIGLDICDECADRLVDYLKKEFGNRMRFKDSKI